MNRYNLKKQIYPLFAILSFIIILPIGMVFSSNSWMWLFVLAYWLLFLAFGYWRACLSCSMLAVTTDELDLEPRKPASA